MTATQPSAPAWGVVLPLKLLSRAKTRLGAYGEAGRAELALAFAYDVLEAVLACPDVRRVVVVTDDPLAAQLLGRDRVRVVPDAPAAGLVAAVEHGEAQLRRDDPAAPVAALAADLPALRAAHLTAALSGALSAALEAAPPRAFVPDAAGVGTTLLTAAGVPLAPAFGPGSRARHLASGATELVAADGLRRDVDTPDDLRAALALGVGPCTARAVERLLLPR